MPKLTSRTSRPPDESLTAPSFGAALSYVRRRQPAELPHAALPFFIRNLFPPRDHWPDCYSAILAGGGVRGGAVYGSSDKLGAHPASAPVTPVDLAATIFWSFGVNPHTEIHDAAARPVRLADGEPIRGLF